MVDGPARAYTHATSSVPRRPLLLLACAAALCFVIVFSTSASVATGVRERVAHGAASVSAFAPLHIPQGRFALGGGSGQRAHDPPAGQRNSSRGDASWYSHWNWRHPFSASVTFDERSLLPPLPARPPVYTYYDATLAKPEAVKDGERRLLLVWRRAWWARGFRPVILGKAEAMKNPRYETLQALSLHENLRAELMRWLAWGHMGTGVLANWLVLPMAGRADHDLAFLRRGRYPALARYEGFGSGLFVGPAEAVDRAVAHVLAAPHVADYRDFLDAARERPDAFAVHATPAGLAFYEGPVIAAQYPAVAAALRDDRARGLADLARLVTAHLHATFVAAYPGGVKALAPHGSTAAILAAPAAALARALATCPTAAPIPNTCPPNRPQCAPCAAPPPAYPAAVANASDAFTVAPVPHPYTLSLLLASKPALSVPQVRRATARDPWLAAATQELYGDQISAYMRILRLKDAVAGPAPHAALWLSAERAWDWRELEWRFGFALPRAGDGAAGDAQAREGAEVAPASLALDARPAPDADPPALEPVLRALPKRPSRNALGQQWDLMAEARKVLASGGKTRGGVNMKDVVEAWHLADLEAWRFVRALEERDKVEREGWEKEESRVSGEAVQKE